MSKYKRVRITMDPAEYRHLQFIAKREGASVAGLIRKAIQKKYFAPIRKRALAELLSLGQIPAQNWRAMKKEISGRLTPAQATE